MDLNLNITGLLPSLAIIAIGIFVCFMGYRFFRLSITLTGATVGYFVGLFAYGKLEPLFNLQTVSWAKTAVVVAFVLALGGLAFYFYLRAIILICTLLIGYRFYVAYEAVKGIDGLPKKLMIMFLGAVLGTVVGLAVYYIQKWAIILSTSYIGAQIICSVAVPFLTGFQFVKNFAETLRGWIFPGSFISSSVVISGLLLLVLMVSGFVVQLKNDK